MFYLLISVYALNFQSISMEVISKMSEELNLEPSTPPSFTAPFAICDPYMKKGPEKCRWFRLLPFSKAMVPLDNEECQASVP